jgi:hypothetical protein
VILGRDIPIDAVVELSGVLGGSGSWTYAQASGSGGGKGQAAEEQGDSRHIDDEGDREVPHRIFGFQFNFQLEIGDEISAGICDPGLFSGLYITMELEPEASSAKAPRHFSHKKLKRRQRSKMPREFSAINFTSEPCEESEASMMIHESAQIHSQLLRVPE